VCLTKPFMPDKLTTNTKGNDSGQNGREYPSPACPIITYKQTISIKAMYLIVTHEGFAFFT